LSRSGGLALGFAIAALLAACNRHDGTASTTTPAAEAAQPKGEGAVWAGTPLRGNNPEALRA
jgi:hypothetical protein